MTQNSIPDSTEIERAIGGAPGRSWLRRGLWLALVFVALAGTGYWYQQRQTAAATVTYDTVPVVHRDLTIQVSATGTVEPLMQVDVGSELSGVARDVLVDENDVVKSGETLARLDTRKLSAQQAKVAAQLLASQARVQTAEASLLENTQGLTRQSRLRARSLSTEQDLEQADAEAKRSEAALAVARADVESARADLALVNTDLEKSVILSPISGIVLKRNVEPGQTVAASLQAPVLFTLAQDISRIQLQVHVDEADVGQVKSGQDAVFTVDAYRDRKFPAHIERMSYSPETVDGVVTYMATLSASNDDRSLRPGMTATAKITVSQYKEALAIPNEALRYVPPKVEQSQGFSITQIFMPRFPRADRGKRDVATDGMRSVYVLDNALPREVRVKTGASDGAFTLIESSDIKDGDKLIIGSHMGQTP
jgi:HlyD family secretion protein